MDWLRAKSESRYIPSGTFASPASCAFRAGQPNNTLAVPEDRRQAMSKEEVKEDDTSEEQKEEETSEEPADGQEKLADVKIPEPSADEQQQEAPKLLKKRSSASDRYSRPGGPIAEAAKTVTGEYRLVP